MLAENQHAKTEPFEPWSVDTGQWGGRVSGAPSAIIPASETMQDSAVTSTLATLQDWVANSETSPFSAHPPNSVLCSVQAISAHPPNSVLCSVQATEDNVQLARENITARLKECSSNACPAPQSNVAESVKITREWSVGPSHSWRKRPRHPDQVSAEIS